MSNPGAAIQARFMTVHEAAELLRLAPKTLYSLVSQRRIPYRKAGRRLLFLESELVDWTRPARTQATDVHVINSIWSLDNFTAKFRCVLIFCRGFAQWFARIVNPQN